MASLHKSASKLNATKKRKSGDDLEEDDELPVISVKGTVKRRKDKVSSAFTLFRLPWELSSPPRCKLPLYRVRNDELTLLCILLQVLLLSSRGVTMRMRHLMADLEALLPHVKKGEFSSSPFLVSLLISSQRLPNRST